MDFYLGVAGLIFVSYFLLRLILRKNDVEIGLRALLISASAIIASVISGIVISFFYPSLVHFGNLAGLFFTSSFMLRKDVENSRYIGIVWSILVYVCWISSSVFSHILFGK